MKTILGLLKDGERLKGQKKLLLMPMFVILKASMTGQWLDVFIRLILSGSAYTVLCIARLAYTQRCGGNGKFGKDRNFF